MTTIRCEFIANDRTLAAMLPWHLAAIFGDRLLGHSTEMAHDAAFVTADLRSPASAEIDQLLQSAQVDLCGLWQPKEVS